MYYQTRMVITHGPGHETWTMSWLHEKLAIEGKTLRKKDSKDERTWTVGDVYRLIPRSEKWVKARDRWRAFTDV